MGPTALFQDESLDRKVFNRLLAVTGQLESLRIQTSNWKAWDCNQLRLPASLRSLTVAYAWPGYGPAYYYHSGRPNPSMLDNTAVGINGEVHAGLRALHLDTRDASLANLSAFVSLVYLGVRLDGDADVSDELLRALGCMPQLKVLVIGGSPVPAKVIAALPEKCPQLEHLTLHACRPNALAPLAQMEELISLSVRLGGVEIEDERGEPVREWSDWDWLEAIAKKGQLEHVHVEGVDLGVNVGCGIIVQNPVSCDIMQ